MTPLQEARQWLWDSSGMPLALRLALRLSLNRLKCPPMLCFPFSQLSIERPLWYSVIPHAYNMAVPSKLGCHEENLDATDLTTFWVHWYWESFPVIFYFPWTSQVELIELQCMTSVQCPWLAAIQQSCEHNTQLCRQRFWLNRRSHDCVINT